MECTSDGVVVMLEMATLPLKSSTDDVSTAFVGLYGASEVQALFSRQDEHAPVAERMLAGGRAVSSAARVRARDPELFPAPNP